MTKPTQRRTIAAPETGFIYTAQLAELFGLPPEHAATLASPLLGAALDLRPGPRGLHICRIHSLVDASAPIRLPDEDDLTLISARRESPPHAFVIKPSKELRKSLRSVISALSNRAVLRLGDGPLESATAVGDDDTAAYSGMPLDGFQRNFMPGINWFSMSFNCSLLVTETYSDYTLWMERDDGPTDMILNLTLDPQRMVGLNFPNALFDGMRPAIDAALKREGAGDRPAPAPAFDIVTQDGRRIAP